MSGNLANFAGSLCRKCSTVWKCWK